MRGFTRVVLAGNVTQDPELRYTVNKKSFARFGVAVNSSWRNANGEVQDSTDFINVVTWNATAENCSKYLKKGRPVLVEGRIRTSTYDAKDGSGKRTSTEVWADNVIFLSSGQGQDGGNYAPRSYGSPTERTASNPYGITPPDESDFGNISEHGFTGGSDFDSTANTKGLDDSGAGIPF